MVSRIPQVFLALLVSICLVPGLARAAPNKTTTKTETKSEGTTTTTVTVDPPADPAKEPEKKEAKKDDKKLSFQAERHAKRVEQIEKALQRMSATAADNDAARKALEEIRGTLDTAEKKLKRGDTGYEASRVTLDKCRDWVTQTAGDSPYATCGDEGTCKLNALGHAKILVDWSNFSAEVARIRADAISACTSDNTLGILEADFAAIPEAVQKVDAAVGGALSSAVYGSVSAAFDSIREWSEAAIKRRIKREAVLALVARLDREFCSNTHTKELLPRTCALADDDALSHASAGTAQLGVIRAAIKADLSELPARGFVTEDEVLPGLDEDARRAAFGGLRRGESPAVLLRDLVDTIDPQSGGPETFACYLELATSSVGFVDALSEQPDELAASAAYLAAMMTSKRCENTVDGSGKVKSVVDAWKNRTEVLEALARQWKLAEAAAKAYDKSAEAIAGAGAQTKKDDEEKKDDGKVDVDVSVNVTQAGEAEKKEEEKKKKDDAKKDEKSPAHTAREARNEAARAHALVAIRYGRALVGLARGSTRIVTKEDSSAGRTSEACEEADAGLAAVGARIDLTEHVVVEDWGSLIAEVTRPTSNELSSGSVEPRRKALRKLAGILTAISTEDDPDKIFAAVEAAAMPAASWRTKMRPGAFTASLGMYAGITGGAEFRFGTYGATYNAGTFAGVAPTIFAPIGLDLSWEANVAATYNWGVFFPLVDPAAFLQYDIHAQGRLPGARLTTVLSPGVAAHVSLGDSALSAMFYAVFRPQLRTWDPTVSGPGASVIQLGGAIVWDIPFFIIRNKARGK